MSLSKKVFSNTIIQILGRVITTITGVITLKLITSNYGPAVYGDYTFVIQYLTVFGIFVDMGIFTIGVREMSKHENKIEEILGNMMTIRLITSFIVLGLGILIAQLIGYNEHIFIGIVIMTIATFLAYIESTIKSVLQYKLEMELQTIGFVLGRIIAVVYIYYTIIEELPFYHLLLGGVYGSIVNLIITWILVLRHVKISLKFDFDYIKDITIKSLPYGIALVLNVIYFRVGSVLLYNYQGSYALGIYGVPLKILDILVIIPPIFMNSVLPILSKSIQDKDNFKINSVIQKSWDFLYMAGIPITVGICVLAPYVIDIVADKESFMEAKLSLYILMFAMLFSFLNTLFGFVLVSVNKQNYLLWINAINLVINIILNFILIFPYSYNGVAVTALVSEFLILIMTMYYSYKFLPFSLKFLNTFKITISALIMGIFLYLFDIYFDLFDWKYLFLAISFAGSIYVLILILTKALTKELIGFKK